MRYADHAVVGQFESPPRRSVNTGQHNWTYFTERRFRTTIRPQEHSKLTFGGGTFAAHAYFRKAGLSSNLRMLLSAGCSVCIACATIALVLSAWEGLWPRRNQDATS